MKFFQCPSTADEKQRMIAKAAYLRAAQRDFVGGDPVEDWLAAEADIERSLQEFCGSDQHRWERAAYRRVRLETRKILAKAEDAIHADAVKHAFDKAKKEIRELGAFLPQTAHRTGETVRQDIAERMERLGHRWENLRIKRSEVLDSFKDGKAHFLDRTARSLRNWTGRPRHKDQ